MNGIATLTQKGQVVIPVAIRDFFGLEPADRLYFEVEEDKIVARPAPNLEEAFGMIKTKKSFSEKEYREAIAEAVAKKFAK